MNTDDLNEDLTALSEEQTTLLAECSLLIHAMNIAQRALVMGLVPPPDRDYAAQLIEETKNVLTHADAVLPEGCLDLLCAPTSAIH